MIGIEALGTPGSRQQPASSRPDYADYVENVEDEPPSSLPQPVQTAEATVLLAEQHAAWGARTAESSPPHEHAAWSADSAELSMPREHVHDAQAGVHTSEQQKLLTAEAAMPSSLSTDAWRAVAAELSQKQHVEMDKTDADSQQQEFAAEVHGMPSHEQVSLQICSS